jgi:hypothetical protein
LQRIDLKAELLGDYVSAVTDEGDIVGAIGINFLA